MSEGTIITPATYVAQLFDDDMDQQAELGLGRTEWTTGLPQNRRRQFAAMMVRSYWAAANLSDTPPRWDQAANSHMVSTDGAGRSDDHQWAMDSIHGAFAALVPANAQPPDEFVILVPTQDAGWAGVIATIIGRGIGAIVVGYLFEKVAEVVDNQLARSEQTAQMINQTAAVVKLVERHVEAEEKAGTTLPLSPAIVTGINALNDTAQVVAKRETPAVTTPIGSGAGKVASAAASWVPFAAVAAVGVGFLLMKDG